MLRNMDFTSRLVAVGAILLVAVVAGIIVLTGTGNDNAPQQALITTYKSIFHPSDSQAVFEGNCTGTGASVCRTSAYCAVLGSPSTFDKVKEYYGRGFAQRSWQELSTGLYTINSTSKLELVEVPPNTSPTMNFDTSVNTLGTAWQTYATTYLITLYSPSETCQ